MMRAVLLCCAALLAAGRAHADVLVLSAAAVRPPLLAIADVARMRVGEMRLDFGTAGAVRDKIVGGSPADLVILPPAILNALVQQGLVVPGSTRALGIVRLGVAMLAEARRPAVATEADVRATLLATSSIGVADPAGGATSGVYLAGMLQRMGLGETLRPKLHRYADGTDAMRALARGEVALALGQISEIKPVPGIELVGPLPDSLQLGTVYAAGVATRATHPDQAAALIEMMSASTAVPLFAAAGFDPPPR